MMQQPKAQCQDYKDSEDQQRVRSARTPSPVAGRRGSKSPGRSQRSQRTTRRRSGSRSRRKSTCCEATDQQQQQQLPSESPRMRRIASLDRQSRNRRRRSGSHSRRMSLRSKSPVSNRNPPVTTPGSGSGRRRLMAKQTSLRGITAGGDMAGSGSGRRRLMAKQTSLRGITAGGDLATSQINVIQTLERGMIRPQLVPSDVSETSDRSLEKTILPATEDSSLKEATATRLTIPGLNKPSKEIRETAKPPSSDPAKLELEGGVQRAGPQGRRFSWWNLPSSRDSGVDEDSDLEEDDLPPVVPPSRRKSLMMQEGEMSASKVAASPKHSQHKRSSSKKKKSTRTNSLDSMESGFTMSTDGDSASFQVDSIEAMLSPTANTQKVSIDNGEDLLSPLPKLPKQNSSGTSTTESTSGSVFSSSQRKRISKKSRAKKTKRKSSGASKRSSRSIGTKPLPESKEDTSTTTKPSNLSLEDNFNGSMNNNFNSSMNQSCDFSAQSRSSAKRSTRTSMSVKQQNNDLNASTSSMSISLSSDGQDLCSIGSDFEGSADFDLDNDEFPPPPRQGSNSATMSASHHEDESGFGEDSFQVLDDSSKRELRCRMKGKSQRSVGGSNSSSQFHRKSPLMTSVEQGIAVIQI